MLRFSFLHASGKKVTRSAGRQKMDGLWMTERWGSKGWRQWPAHGWGQSGLYLQAVLLLQAGWALHMSCTSLMEISSKMKLVSQSLPGMAVRRSRLYCWDTGPQLRSLCKAWSHPGCWKLCRLPKLSYEPLCGQELRKDHPTPLDFLSETSATHRGMHNRFSSWQAARNFTWWWPQGWKKAPSKISY